MKLTKRHAIMGIVMIAALLAVAADRLLFQDETSGPRRASASPRAGDASMLAAQEVAGAGAVDTLARQSSIAERLDALRRTLAGGAAGARDAFQLVDPWRSELIGSDSEKPASPSVKPELVFAQRHRLNSVLVAGPQGMVVVDDTTLRIGERFDGARLVLVTPEKAVFECGKVRIELNFAPMTAPEGGR